MKRKIVFVIAFLLFLPSFSIGNENKRYEVETLQKFSNHSFEELEKMFPENGSIFEFEKDKKMLNDLFENIKSRGKMDISLLPFSNRSFLKRNLEILHRDLFHYDLSGDHQLNTPHSCKNF